MSGKNGKYATEDLLPGQSRSAGGRILRKYDDAPSTLQSLDPILLNKKQAALPQKEEDKENQHLNINGRVDVTVSSQRSTLPPNLIRNDAHSSSYILNQSYSQHSVISSVSASNNPLLEKQIKEINK